MDRPERRHRRIQFLRDVGVNVLANLAAAPPIYLLGVAVGLFPKSRPAFGVALVALGVMVLCVPMFAAEIFRRSYRGEFYLGVGFLAGGVCALAINFDVLRISPDVALDHVYWWLLTLFGLLCFPMGGWFIHLARRERKDHQARSRRIEGLHWFDGHP